MILLLTLKGFLDIISKDEKMFMEVFIVKAKKTIKAVVAFMLIICAVFSMAACKKKEEVSRDKLPNQYETNRYYFRQGYTDLWKINLQGENGYLVTDYEEQGLALQLIPYERTESKDDEGNVTYTPGTNIVEGVQYNVFCNWDKEGFSMTSSSNDISGMVMDESSNLYFNTLNYVENPRTNYLPNEEAQNATYNKMQWKQCEYTFTGDDGEQWKGVWNLLTKGTNYYVVSYEAHESKYDTYYADFTEMINDFKQIGFEEDESVG